MPVAATKSLGKTSFVKEILFDNPQANPAAVNEAWAAAGMDGAISATLVNKMRSELGLTGNLRARPVKAKAATVAKREKKQSKKVSVKAKSPAATMEATSAEPSTRKTPRAETLVRVEAEIDRLLFMVMNVGGLTEVEDSLRESRRRLYKSL